MKLINKAKQSTSTSRRVFYKQETLRKRRKTIRSNQFHGSLMRNKSLLPTSKETKGNAILQGKCNM